MFLGFTTYTGAFISLPPFLTLIKYYNVQPINKEGKPTIHNMNLHCGKRKAMMRKSGKWRWRWKVKLMTEIDLFKNIISKMEQQNIFCAKHQQKVKYICSDSNCQHNIFICDKCKIKSSDHFFAHSKYILKFNDFLPSFHQKISLPSLQNSLNECEKYIKEHKTNYKNDLKNIHELVEKLRKCFAEIADEYEETFKSMITNEMERLEDGYEKIKEDLGEWKKQMKEFEGFLQQKTEQKVKKLITEYGKGFKVRAQTKSLKEKIALSKTNKFFQFEQEKVEQMNKMLSDLCNHFFTQLQDSITQQRSKTSTKTSLISDKISMKVSHLSIISQNSSLSHKQYRKVNLPDINSKVQQNRSKLQDFMFSIQCKQFQKLIEGPYLYPEGTYLGQYRNFLREGIGIMIFKDGCIYEGQWQNDHISGYGRLIKQSSFYEGQVVNGKAEGYGKYKSEEKEYEGQWKQDKRHGKGSQRYFNQKRKYTGQFINNFYEGKGQLIEKDFTYVGYFKQGLFHSNGTINYGNGEIYEGTFYNGQRYMGKHLYNDQSYYSGMFKNDVPNGTGTFVWPDNTKFEGYWKNGKQEGRGMQIQPNGEELKGIWKEGCWQQWI